MAKHKYIKTPEIWRQVKGYNGYEVSNLGNIRSYRKRNSKNLYKQPHYITPSKTGRGGAYLHFYASNELGSRKLLVHRCVAEAFLVNSHSKPEVNHKDKNGHNNDLSNLEWVTSKENKLHAAGGSKNTPKVCLDRNNFRVHFTLNGARKSKNFKEHSEALHFAENIYK